ncbi:hypothetical protein JI721_13755 [Alicyclobacillus cycloheptanicus]|uniref:Uncharacterized protein n=1 Tax=Alicyclobacillus cycloheptanicus TaxID=1457 RepID=A0ABT9XJL5_9BACL|nr:hypothetical protein [Alicyclobacillus cycloheptanicus]MDQ0190491.1 hypothetical protein [Alicyclobacillus cycloheptanicus]WDM00746.1 hypothetical protein JI721_13755 [Alicyclobacillus cycloheptanicus]
MSGAKSSHQAVDAARRGGFHKDWIRQMLKRALAMTLFLGVLIGGGAAAFSLLAAGISALSNATAQTQSQSDAAQTTAAGSGSSTTGTAAPSAGSVAPSAGSAASPASSAAADDGQLYGDTGAYGAYGEAGWSESSAQPAPSVIDKLNNQLDHMSSPIMGAIDGGGITVGNRVQSAFGRMLAGVINTLFLEQNDAPASSAASAGSGAETGAIQ